MLSYTQLLANGNFVIVNKALIQEIGIKPAIMLSELCNIAGYKHAEEHEGEFTATLDEIQQAVGLTRREQENAIKTLTDYQIIESEVKGVPAKRHFKIREDMIRDYMYFGETTREYNKNKKNKHRFEL